VTDTLGRVLARVVRECTAVEKGERCLLVTDHGDTGIRRALEGAVRSCGGTLAVAELSAGDYRDGRVPAGLGEEMASAEVVYVLTRGIFPHRPRREAARAGARVLSLCMVDDTMALRALDVDYAELSRATRKLAEILSSAGEALVTTPSGTELRFGLGGGPVLWIDGLAREPGQASALPAGVAAVLPFPGTAAGRIVLDGSLASVGLLEEPVVLEVEGGRVVEIRGGAAAGVLRRALRQDANASFVAEFGMGTNPRAARTGNLVEDERVRGSAHFGFGGNVHLGGTVASSVHLDGTLREPTVYLDSRPIVKDGKLEL